MLESMLMLVLLSEMSFPALSEEYAILFTCMIYIVSLTIRIHHESINVSQPVY